MLLRVISFMFAHFSARTMCTRGMLVATQMRRFYIDLSDAAVKAAIALVHSRYSTNTTPSWGEAHQIVTLFTTAKSIR